MSGNSISLPAGFAEIRVKGKTAFVPSAEIEGRTIIATGKWLKTAVILDQDLAEGELIRNPDSFISALKRSDLQADVFTFSKGRRMCCQNLNLILNWTTMPLCR